MFLQNWLFQLKFSPTRNKTIVDLKQQIFFFPGRLNKKNSLLSRSSVKYEET